jgi:4-hydroxybenzoate polyprenyltransferase
VKDIEDQPGDAAAGIHTFAVRHGSEKTYRLAGLVLFPTVLLAVAPAIFGFENILFSLHFALAAVLLLWISIAIYRTTSASEATIHSKRLKLALFYGLLGILWL